LLFVPDAVDILMYPTCCALFVNSQSAEVFEWLVVGDNHHGWWTFTMGGSSQ